MGRLIFCLCLMGVSLLRAAGTAEHVVVIVWDGLRPDFVTPENTPTLAALAKNGTFFNRHHPVYPSSTEVNGTALLTGMYPQTSGIVGNREFRPDLWPDGAMATENRAMIQKGDALTNGKYLAAPTICEILQAKGVPTAVAGTKPVTILADRSEQRTSEAARASVNIYEGHTLPADKLAEIESALGPFPKEITHPNIGQNTWTARALTEQLWKSGIPKFSLLWLSDPDFAQHHTQAGSEEALASLKANDELLAQLLAKLDAAKVRDKTDILIVSDHGFSTITKIVNITELLTQAGFSVHRNQFRKKPQPGDILMVGNGGSQFFYVIGRDQEITRKLVEFLQHADFTGVIFSRIPLAGTFALETARINSLNAPDVVLSMRWDDAANAAGVKGGLIADGNPTSRQPGQGTHGSLSRYDMRNTLIAAGPDFHAGLVSDQPSGNTDVAPTILWIFGIEPPQKMDGRLLFEALNTPLNYKYSEEEKTLDASNDTWSQYLKTHAISGTLYLDEGNGKQTAK